MDKKHTVSFHEINCRKMRGGKHPHWNSYHPFIPSIVGYGSTADLAIKDFQKQWREKMRRASKGGK